MDHCSLQCELKPISADASRSDDGMLTVGVLGMLCLTCALTPTLSPPRGRQEAGCCVAVPDMTVRANLCSVYTGSRCPGLQCTFILMPGKKEGWATGFLPAPPAERKTPQAPACSAKPYSCSLELLFRVCLRDCKCSPTPGPLSHGGPLHIHATSPVRRWQLVRHLLERYVEVLTLV